MWVSGRPNMLVLKLTMTYLGLRCLSSQALTLSGEVGFIALHLKCPSLGECQCGSRHFLNYWACVGFDPAPGPTLKKALCHTCLVGEMYDKYTRQIIWSQPENLIKNKLMRLLCCSNWSQSRNKGRLWCHSPTRHVTGF